jgi:hypothetical protein
MTLPDLQSLLNEKAVVSVLSAIGGTLFGVVLSALRGRLKVIEYTVAHDRLGLSADDAIFGSVRVTWQGVDLTNLYSSVVTVENSTLNDFTNLKLKVYTGDTSLLNERTEINGTTYVLKYTPEFEASIGVPVGAKPTDAQFDIFRHSREYAVPVLNRGQRLVLHYLTTVPNSASSPNVWVDLLHQGAQISFRPLLQQVHGVPIKIALSLGLLACFFVLVLSSFYVRQPWVAASISMVFGLMAQSVGAGIYRGVRFVSRMLSK